MSSGEITSDPKGMLEVLERAWQKIRRPVGSAAVRATVSEVRWLAADDINSAHSGSFAPQS